MCYLKNTFVKSYLMNLKSIKIGAMSLLMAAGFMNNGANAQVVEQGKVIVDAYYGFPNLYTAVFKAAYANSGSELNVKASGIGPLGVRGEYLVTDKIGVGLDIGFSSSKLTYQEDGQVYNSTTGNYDAITYDYNLKTSKIGVIATFNYHFLDNDKFDFYAVTGIGYSNRKFTFDSTDPDYVPASIKSIIPIGSKIGIGARYFFTDNIGAQAQLCVGQGGIANIGITAKF